MATRKQDICKKYGLQSRVDESLVNKRIKGSTLYYYNDPFVMCYISTKMFSLKCKSLKALLGMFVWPSTFAFDPWLPPYPSTFNLTAVMGGSTEDCGVTPPCNLLFVSDQAG